MMFHILKRAVALIRKLGRLDAGLDDLKAQQGKLLSMAVLQLQSGSIKDYEFRVYSQWGEDGIIQKLISCIDIPNKTFIEFGVEDFSESNCRFLMTNNFWNGFVIDGSERNIAQLRGSSYFWRHQLEARHAFITAENINELLEGSRFEHDLGLLSIDVDGVDYWIFEAISHYRPRIFIAEYNAVFGADRPISVPYDPTFVRTRAHYSNLYFGASLPALTFLANKRGYALVGTNSGACNAFFVREDLVHQTPFRPLSAKEGFTKSVARESRDKSGQLTYADSEARYEIIRGLPVVNVVTGEKEKL